ncbi:MAG: hypothetical protein ACOY0T_38035 [Myxococcota bacterium]
MSKRSFNGLFKCLGAVSVALIAAGCSSAVNESAEQTTSQAEELGESFSSCVAANSSTDWVSGVLTINATANTTGTIIVSPGNGVVKINGRTCKTAAGATIALTAVKNLVINGKAASSDTFVLDFSAGLPKAPLLQAGGIVIDGGETVASTKTPDTVVVKGSTGVDPVSVGVDATAPGTDGQIDISLTATSKIANVHLKKIGRLAQGPYQANTIYSLGTGDDTFTGLGFGSIANPMPIGMSIYGGAGNDTIVGGSGSDKISGGGQATDTLDYTGRTSSDVFLDMDSSKVTVWGGDLRGVKMGTETISIDAGSGAQMVTFASEATPAAIAAKINAAHASLANVASVVGNRLRLTATKLIISGGNSVGAVKLGLMGGLYENKSNDGTPGAQMALPWAAPAAWATSGAFNVGDIVVPSSANGYWYRATVAGDGDTTTEPTWPTTIGATVVDNEVTWVCAGKTLFASATYSYGDVVYDTSKSAVYKAAVGSGGTALAALDTTVGNTATDGGITWTTVGDDWAATTAYLTTDYVVKAGGHFFKCVTAGTSGATVPTWPTIKGGQVKDGTAVWEYMGVAAAPAAKTQYAAGDFVFDSTNVLLGQASISSTMTASGAPAFPGSAGTFVDGDILWVYAGAQAEADDVQGISVVNSGAGNDILIGNTAANTLNGNDGNDVLNGGAAQVVSSACTTDKLNGGNGNDWFDMGVDDNIASLTKNDCNQTVAGGAGVDVVDYSLRTSNGKVLLKLDGTTLSGEQTTIPKEGDKLANDLEVVLGGAGDDTITGTDNGDFLFGGKGKDAIYGGKGDDHVYGGPGDDSLYGDVGSDTFYELTAYPAATAWNEPLVSAGAFAGVGLAIFGSDKPGAGDDVVFGGGDLTETNKVDVTDALNPTKIAICSDSAATNTGLGSCATGKSDYIGISLDGTSTSGSGTANTFVNIEYVAGSLTQANTFLGSANAETFEGGAAVDTVLGQGGQDALYGYPDPATGFPVDHTSADILCGGDDDDVLQAGLLSTTDGEGQMDQAHANQGTTAVLFTAAAPVAQRPNYCTNWPNASSPYTVIQGVNLCFGGGTKQSCAN